MPENQISYEVVFYNKQKIRILTDYDPLSLEGVINHAMKERNILMFDEDIEEADWGQIILINPSQIAYIRALSRE